MTRVTVNDLDDFRQNLRELNLTDKFGVKITEPTDFSWGREVNLIDIAGVCWHFAEGS